MIVEIPVVSFGLVAGRLEAVAVADLMYHGTARCVQSHTIVDYRDGRPAYLSDWYFEVPG